MFEQVKQEIDDKIKTNGNNEITATRLNGVLQDMMDSAAEEIRNVAQSVGDQVEANPEDAPTMILTKIKIGETIYTAPQGPQGAPGEDGQDGQPGAPGPANTLSIGTVQSGQTAAANITGTAPNQVLNLTLPKGDQGDPGQNAVNPFKGWFDADITGESGSKIVDDTANLPASPTVGDYAYVKTLDITGAAPSQTETPVVKIYECTTAGSWSDSDRTADTSNVQTFASGEEVNETYIDDTNLVNPKGGALPTAEDVLQLKAKLDGVTASETKVMTITDWHPSDKTSGYFKLNGTWYNSSNQMSTIIDVTGYKHVRFLGAIKNGTPPSNHPAWGFLDSDYNPIINTLIYYAYDNTLSEEKLVELSSSVPEGAKYLIACYNLFGVITTDNFYCYLQSGESIGEFIGRIEHDVVACKKACDTLQFGNNPIGEPISPTNEFSGLLIGKTGNITTGSQYQKVYCYPISSEDRYVYVDLHVAAASTLVGGVWLIDNVSTIVDGGSIPLTDELNEPHNTGAGNPRDVDTEFFVPAGRILVVTYSIYNSNSYLNVYETEYNSQVIKDIQNDITELQGETADLTELEEEVEQIKEKTDNLEETDAYTDISSSIMTVDGNLAIGKNSNTISSSSQSYWKMCYFQARQNNWKLRVKVVSNNALSYKIGQVFLVDNVSEIAEGYTTIPLVNGIYNSDSSPIDATVDVPSGKIVVISTTTYQVPSRHSFEYYEVTKTLMFLSDIEQLQEDVREKVSIQQIEPDYIDAANPLAIVKETPGYTSIFRKMGVIGGSMSTGWHSHNTGTVSANMPEYSYLQFMARLCGAEGHNFSRGGLSARSWPQNDMMENFYDTNKKCQMYLVQLGNNDLAYHSDHPEYTLGTVADLTPTSGTSIADYAYNTDTFYGNMARIINEVRKVQPRAYMFLSTFLKGYGTVPSDFDYNVAIRNIVDYYSDSSNRPTGDELHYYLIDIYEYGQPYSFYSTGIHDGTVKGSHLVATGYNYWAYEFCTYIDWIIKNNMSEFNDVAFVGTDDYN